MFSQTYLAAATVLLATANAHLFMQSPTPIQGSAPKDPLSEDGSNFPCHGASFITGKGGQNMAVGSSQLLAFDLGISGNFGQNWAVHGGGSCQISITYETDAQKVKDPNNWKVLYSMIGGCPTNWPDNLNSAPKGAAPCIGDDVQCVNSFNFTIPPEVKNGKATLAWTWFNSIGNREMYMNCADVTITGAQGDGKLDSLPAMQVANIAAGGYGSGCSTDQYAFYEFANPGQYVTTKTVAGAAKAQIATVFPIKPFKGNCGAQKAAAQPTGNANANPTSAQAPAAAQPTGQSGGFIGANPPAAATSKASGQGSGSGRGSGGNPGGVFAPGAASATTLATQAAATAAPAATSAAAAPPAAQPSAAAPAAAAPQNGSSGSCAAGASACPTDGVVVCLPDNKWGLCDHGCVVPQLMAAGMACDAGAMKAATGSKVRRAHPHGSAHRRRSL